MTIEWLGFLASVLGLLVSLIGLGWAIKVAKGARNASEEARKASFDTRSRIVNHLQTVSVQRAIGLIQRIKLLHESDQWDRALEQYQVLREMISHIVNSYPESDWEGIARLSTARTRIGEMEVAVGRSAAQGMADRQRIRFQHELNQIQSDLEDLASSSTMGD